MTRNKNHECYEQRYVYETDSSSSEGSIIVQKSNHGKPDTTRKQVENNSSGKNNGSSKKHTMKKKNKEYHRKHSTEKTQEFSKKRIPEVPSVRLVKENNEQSKRINNEITTPVSPDIEKKQTTECRSCSQSPQSNIRSYDKAKVVYNFHGLLTPYIEGEDDVSKENKLRNRPDYTTAQNRKNQQVPRTVRKHPQAHYRNQFSKKVESKGTQNTEPASPSAITEYKDYSSGSSNIKGTLSSMYRYMKVRNEPVLSSYAMEHLHKYGKPPFFNAREHAGRCHSDFDV